MQTNGAKRRKVKDEEAEGQRAAGAEGADAGGAEAEAAGEGHAQKTPNSLSIQYVVCEADEKIAQLVGWVVGHEVGWND